MSGKGLKFNTYKTYKMINYKVKLRVKDLNRHVFTKLKQMASGIF